MAEACPHMTAAQYAARRGCSASYVWRLRRKGMLEECPCGEIDPIASDDRLARELDPLRGGDHSAGAGSAINGAGRNQQPGRNRPINDATTLPEAVRRERLAKARLAELELGELAGTLIRKDEAQRATVTLVRQAVARMGLMGGRLRGQLAATSNPRKCQTLIDDEIAVICADMCRDADKVAARDVDTVAEQQADPKPNSKPGRPRTRTGISHQQEELT